MILVCEIKGCSMQRLVRSFSLETPSSLDPLSDPLLHQNMAWVSTDTHTYSDLFTTVELFSPAVKRLCCLQECPSWSAWWKTSLCTRRMMACSTISMSPSCCTTTGVVAQMLSGRSLVQMMFDFSCLLIGPHLCFQVSPCHPEDPQRALLWRRAAGLCEWNFTQLLLQLAAPPEDGNGSSLSTSVFDIMSEVSPLHRPQKPSASTSAPQADSLRPRNEDMWLQYLEPPAAAAKKCGWAESIFLYYLYIFFSFKEVGLLRMAVCVFLGDTKRLCNHYTFILLVM